MSCIAVCEVIDHPDVKCTLENKTRNGQTNTGGRARAKNSEGGDVPERYYVVTNNELLRVKYLLVYVEKHKTERYSIRISMARSSCSCTNCPGYCFFM